MRHPTSTTGEGQLLPLVQCANSRVVMKEGFCPVSSSSDAAPPVQRRRPDLPAHCRVAVRILSWPPSATDRRGQPDAPARDGFLGHERACLLCGVSRGAVARNHKAHCGWSARRGSNSPAELPFGPIRKYSSLSAHYLSSQRAEWLLTRS